MKVATLEENTIESYIMSDTQTIPFYSYINAVHFPISC